MNAAAIAGEAASAGTWRTTVARNASVTLVARLAYLASRLAIPPFVLAQVGLERYGLWAATFILAGYMGVMTLGFSGAYVKFVAEYSARSDYNGINRLLSTGIAISAPTYMLLFAAVMAAWPWLYGWSGLGAGLEAEARATVFAVLGAFLAGMLFWVFADLLNGMQQIAEMQMIQTFCYLVETALIFVLVGMGRGLQGLSEAFLARTMLCVVMAAWRCHRMFPWLRLSPRLVTASAARTIFRFGGIVQLQSALSVLLASIDRAVALPALGPGAAGTLDVARKWPGGASDLVSSLFSAFLPAASKLAAGDAAGENVRELYLRGSRYVALLSASLCAALCLFAEPILRVWIGVPLEDAAAALCVFGAAMQVHLLTGPGTSILRGIGRLAGDFHYILPNAAALILFLAVLRVWAGQWSVLSISVAVGAATLVSAMWVIAFACRVLRVRWRQYLSAVWAPGAAAYLAAAAVAIPVYTLAAGADRWLTAAILACGLAAYGCLLVLLLGVWALEPWERALAVSRIRQAARYLQGESQ